MHTYLTETMGLQSSDTVSNSQPHKQRHFMRHATGLHLVSSPAWVIPLARVRARHLLMVLAGRWPPTTAHRDGE